MAPLVDHFSLHYHYCKGDKVEHIRLIKRGKRSSIARARIYNGHGMEEKEMELDDHHYDRANFCLRFIRAVQRVTPRLRDLSAES